MKIYVCHLSSSLLMPALIQPFSLFLSQEHKRGQCQKMQSSWVHPSLRVWATHLSVSVFALQILPLRGCRLQHFDFGGAVLARGFLPRLGAVLGPLSAASQVHHGQVHHFRNVVAGTHPEFARKGPCLFPCTLHRPIQSHFFPFALFLCYPPLDSHAIL